jgi:hypothetical protein
MPDLFPSDHDRLVRLESQVDDLRHWRDVLTEHLDAQFDQIDAKIDSRVGALDSKIDAKVDELSQHVDAGFVSLRDRMDAAIKDLRLALPGWAQIAIYVLLGLLAFVGGVMWHGRG